MALTAELPAHQKAAVLKGLRHLQPFPPVLIELMRMVSEEEVKYKEVVELIRSDAAVATEVMRVANSPLSGSWGRVSSVMHAVVMVGVERLKGLVITTALRNFAHPVLETPALLRCWRHNLACAFLCEELAAAFFLPKDTCYTAGLLHDVGRIALLAAHPSDYVAMLEAAERERADARDLERQVFGLDHSEAGQWLVREWDLPDEFLEITGRHHEEAFTDKVDKLTVVQLGCRLADALGFAATAVQAETGLKAIEAKLPTRACRGFASEADMCMNVADRINALECSLIM